MKVGVIMYQTSTTKGQELVAQRMVKELRRQGHEAHLITGVFHDQALVASNEEVEKAGGYLRSFDEGLGIPVVRIQSRKEKWPPRRVTFVDFVSTLAKVTDALGLDALVTHSTLWNGPEDAAKFVEWRRNQARGGAPVLCPVLCHMSHFQEPTDERYDLPERTFREAWNSASLPVIMRLADFVLVTTPYERDQMKRMGADDKKLILFPGGIDVAVLESEHTALRRKYGVPDGPRLITYLGTVEERKNAGALVKVARALERRTDAHFVIAGKSDGAYGQQVRAAAAGLTNVTFTGPVSDEDVPALIRESYLNITLSRSEALGLSQLEFMFNGVPVVTSGVGGQSWIVKDGASGVVVNGPDDVEGAVSAISELLDNPNRRDKLGKKSKEIASQFTMPKLIQELVRSISSRVNTEGGERNRFRPDEQLIEAWAKKGYRVAVTTRALIVETAKGGAPAIIPLGEITRARARLKHSWRVLAAGAAASLCLYLAEMLDPPATSELGSWLASLASVSRPDLAIALAAGVASAPLLLGVAAFRKKARRGYSVEHGAGETFVPAEFAKALRIVDELTPQSLFPKGP